MSNQPHEIWSNLLAVASALQEKGLVVEFNGKYTEPARLEAKIDANRGDESMGGEYDDGDRNKNAAEEFYKNVEYTEINKCRNYTVKFIDGAIAQYFCRFSGGNINRQRLTFYQSPWTHPYDKKSREYDEWLESAGDIEDEAKVLFGWESLEHRDIVNLRIEYAPEQYRQLLHPRTHLHLSGREECRIPVSGPLGVAAFFRFLIKNFYSDAWERLNHVLRDPVKVEFGSTIDEIESMHINIVIPNTSRGEV